MGCGGSARVEPDAEACPLAVDVMRDVTTTLQGTSHDMLAVLAQSCLAIGEHLGVSGGPIAGTPTAEEVETVCETAGEALHGAVAMTSVDTSPWTSKCQASSEAEQICLSDCDDEACPSLCAAWGAAAGQCTTPDITVTSDDGALAAVLEEHLPVHVQARAFGVFVMQDAAAPVATELTELDAAGLPEDCRERALGLTEDLEDVVQGLTTAVDASLHILTPVGP